MNENNKIVSSKLMKIILGLFLCLISVIMILDVGYIGRTLTFAFTFLFGFTSYFFYALFFVIGIVLIFRQKDTKIHIGAYVTGIVIVLIATQMLLTYIFEPGIVFASLGTKIQTLYDPANYYNAAYIHQWPFMFQCLFPNVSNLKVGGGVIGDSLISALNEWLNLSSQAILIISLVFFLGIALFMIPLVVKIVKKQKTVEKIPAPKKNTESLVKDNTLETILNASKTEDEPKHDLDIKKPTIQIQAASYNNDNPSQGSLSFADTNYTPNGGLQRAKFQKDANSLEQLNETISKPVIDKIEQPVQASKKTVEEIPVKTEQMSLDFGAKPVPDLTSVQPEFVDPIEKDNIVKEKPVVKPVVKKQRVKFIPPESNLLNDYEVQDSSTKNNTVAEQRKDKINEILQNFRIGASCVGFVVGPSVTRFNVSYDSAVSVKTVSSAFDDIQLRLGGIVGRFQPIVEGEPYSGLELPNAVITTVGFKDILNALPPFDKKPLSVAFGKDISGKVIFADFSEFPHMLISGTTGSGKSIFIHSIIMTLIMRNNPDDLKIVLVDPKRVEMAMYADEPHLLCPIITEAAKAKVCMEKLDKEMERRYDILAQSGSNDMKSYREYCKEHPGAEWLPYIVVILDEYADLVDRAKDISQYVVSIAQKARACGIHIAISTQRPSTNVITGVIKGNLPTRVALMTSSPVDSVTIIGEGGAEKLLGKGDMLVQSPLISRTGCVRLQGCFVSNKEIVRVVEYLKKNYKVEYNEEFMDLLDHSKDPVTPSYGPMEEGSVGDEKYLDVKEMVMQQDYTSISRIQREFGFGFSRAGKIFSRLQKEGIVAAAPDSPGSSKGCKVLIHDAGFNKQSDVGSSELTSTQKQ